MTTSVPPSSQPPVVYPPTYTTTVIQVVEPDSGVCPFCGRHTGHITVKKCGPVGIIWGILLSPWLLCWIPMIMSNCKDT